MDLGEPIEELEVVPREDPVPRVPLEEPLLIPEIAPEKETVPV